MHRLRAVLTALMLGAPLAASAADITRIASSFDEDDPFDLIIDLGFERTQNRARITREQLAADGSGRQDVNELSYKGVDSRLNIRLAIGLYKDLELSFGLPLILQQNDSYEFGSGTTAENSTIIHNCLNPDGTLTRPDCLQNGTGERALFTVPSKHHRGGLGNMRFGLAYAIFNQLRDDTKPHWVLGIDYEAPTAKQRDPTMDTTNSDNRGDVGDRVHKYTLYTALSRRLGVVEPYFRAHYTLPVPGPGIYSNCFNQDNDPPTLGRPENCFTGPWDRKETGIKYPHMAGFLFGSEFTAFTNAAKTQSFTLDLRAIGNYVARGRYYNELSSAMGKLLTSQDYFQVGGTVGATAGSGNSFRLHAAGTFLYNTDHTLTDEDIGEDADGNGVDIVEGSTEVNPNFDFRTDLVSRRFRAVSSKTFRLDLMVTFSF